MIGQQSHYSMVEVRFKAKKKSKNTRKKKREQRSSGDLFFQRLHNWKTNPFLGTNSLQVSIGRDFLGSKGVKAARTIIQNAFLARKRYDLYRLHSTCLLTLTIP